MTVHRHTPMALSSIVAFNHLLTQGMLELFFGDVSEQMGHLCCKTNIWAVNVIVECAEEHQTLINISFCQNLVVHPVV